MISIVIPALNEEKYIGRLLDSIAQQDFDEGIEIVVADAGSTDATKKIIESHKRNFFKVLIVKGGMPAVGRNNGAKASLGDPIFFIDADLIIPERDFLKKAVDYFRKKNLDIAATYLRPDSEWWVDKFLSHLYNIFLQIIKFFRPSGSMCIAASRELFNKTGGYPEDVVMAEDHDFVNAASKIGRYGIIPYAPIFSMRRFNKEGRPRVLYKYLLSSLHLIFFGPIKKSIFKYEFGNFDEKHHNERSKTAL
ncbi:MAG: glycosyltransferase [Patescibacteria group bacterium]